MLRGKEMSNVPNLSRRNLVQAAALVPFQAVRSTAANDAVKVGLVGAGNRGTYDGGNIVKDPRAREVTWEEMMNA
jgi:hypothetical protein